MIYYNTAGDWNRFSIYDLPPTLRLSPDFRSVKYYGGAQTRFVSAFLESPQRKLKYRLFRCYGTHVHIGMRVRDAYRDPTLPLRFDPHTWFICRAGSQLFEGGRAGMNTVNNIPEGAIVTVEKDFQTQSLKFRVNGADPINKEGLSFGWRPTGLSPEAFDALVGVVEFDSTNLGDEVQLVN